jgi:hypothetical protein
MLNPDEALVFALDADSRELRHVREGRTGQHCNRVCPGCGQRLEAVNAESRVYKNRPHFRHLGGQDRRHCATSSLKAAMVEALADPGAIRLPAIVSGNELFALDGAIDEPLMFQSAAIDDFTDAVLRLPDGRELRVRVEVRDTRALDGDGQFDLVLFIPPDKLESLQSVGDLRRYLTLDPLAWRWCRNQIRPSLITEPSALTTTTVAPLSPQVMAPLLPPGFQDFTPERFSALPIPSRTGRERRKLPEVRMSNPDGSVTVFHRWRHPNGQMEEKVEKIWPT